MDIYLFTVCQSFNRIKLSVTISSFKFYSCTFSHIFFVIFLIFLPKIWNCPLISLIQKWHVWCHCRFTHNGTVFTTSMAKIVVYQFFYTKQLYRRFHTISERKSQSQNIRNQTVVRCPLIETRQCFLSNFYFIWFNSSIVRV